MGIEELSKKKLEEMRFELYNSDFECIATKCENCSAKKECDNFDLAKEKLMRKLK